MSKRLTIPALLLPSVVIAIPQLIISLFLIEIAFSFDREVGVAGQMVTAQSIASAMMALLMGAFSVRYSHKSLLLVGVVVLSVSAMGCAVSPTFSLLLVAYSVMGLSFSMVRPMSQALIGSLFSARARIRGRGFSFVLAS